MARYPAAFINAIAEEGTKDEAILYLQKTWDENVELRQLIQELRADLYRAQEAVNKMRNKYEDVEVRG